MNKDRLLADAKAKALALAPGYVPPKPSVFHLPGAPGEASLSMALDDFYKKGQATWHDVVIGDALADVLSGGDTHMGIAVTEEQLLPKEREAFMSLIHTKPSQDRVAYMLANNKPLREEPLKESRTMAELRANRDAITLPRRPYNGKPISGKDYKKLRWLSRATWLMYKFQ
jgi:3-hydroxyacyl-CoA dehydrogenase